MDGSPRPRTRAASVTVHLLASCAVGLFVWLVSGRAGFVNYDAAWSLDWMRELVAGGSRPDLTRLFSPTPHPLSDLFSALLVPLSDAGGPAVGRAAETVLVVLAMFWLGALGVVTFRLGAAWFGPAAGVVAAVLVLTREPVLSYGLRTYLDLPYAVFLLLALLAETRRPLNGARTIAWITLAGLLRPEAWLLAAAYVAYLVVWQVRGDAGAAADGPAGSAAAEGGPAVVPTPADGGPTVATTPADGGPTVATPAAGATARPDDTTPVPHGRSGIRRDPVESQSVPAKGARRRVPRVAIRPLLPLVALSLIAPLGWLIEGLVLTGDPLQALTGTQQNAADLDRVTGLSSAVTVMPRRLGEIVREPVLLAALGGVLLSLAFLRRRAMLGVGAAIAAGLGFFALAVAGLPLLTRYLVFPATLIIVFAAAGLLGWRHLAPGHRWRRPWQAFAVVAALAFLVFLPSQVDRLDRLGNALALQGRVIDDLRTVTGDVVRPVLEGTGACPARGRGDVDVALPNHRAIPQVLLWMGRPGDGDETGTGEDERAPGAEPYPSVGAIGTRVRSRALRSRVVLLPSSERVARGFILDRADNGRGLPAAPAGSVRAGTLGTWTVYGADRACASALRARLAG